MKYPKIRPLGHIDNDGILTSGSVVILEKIDGANFRFKYDEETDSIICGSRRTWFTEHGKPANIERVNKQFRHCVKYIYATIDIERLSTIDANEDGLLFFGESLHRHSIDYDKWDGDKPDVDSEIPNFLGFDVYSESKDQFLPHDEVERIFKEIGLETVPVVDKGEAKEFAPDAIEVPQSAFREPDDDAETEFNQQGLAEGVVIKNNDKDLRAKLVTDALREHSFKGTNPSERREITGAAQLFIDRYVTNARIEKKIYELLDEGKYDTMEMKMMKDLPRKVAEDVFAEHGWDILNDDEIELTEEIKDEIRSQLSRKCSRVLRSVMRTR